MADEPDRNRVSIASDVDRSVVVDAWREQALFGGERFAGAGRRCACCHVVAVDSVVEFLDGVDFGDGYEVVAAEGLAKASTS